MIKGIDVSHYQNSINWKKVKAGGVQFAILRMGIGSNIASQTDKQIFNNIKGCEENGIPYGLYIYSYALNKEDAHSEADHMLRIARQCNPTLGLWYDMEDADHYKAKNGFEPRQHKAELTEFCKIFLEDCKKAGFDNVGVYAAYDYFMNILDLAALRKMGKIWLAHWGINKPSLPCEIWQYSSNGNVSGIAGRTDMNYYYGNFPGVEYPTPAEPAVPVKPAPDNVKARYKVKRGDYLTKIAKMHSTTVEELASINSLRNPNLIHTGQVLLVPKKYIVQPGDTLSKIAVEHLTTVSKLAEVNKDTIKNVNLIKVNQIIKLV